VRSECGKLMKLMLDGIYNTALSHFQGSGEPRARNNTPPKMQSAIDW
jgi:hypothetical protein